MFFYNKKKTSIAGLLFCVLSATDFATCLSWPSVLLYHASTIDLDKMTCTGSETAYGRQPQNCVAEATLTQLVLTTIMLSFNCTAVITTGVLTILRSVQIKYPFFPIRKRLVVAVLPILISLNVTLAVVQNFVPQLGGKVFYPYSFVAAAQNPFNLQVNDDKKAQLLSIIISCMNLGILQISAFCAAIASAVTLFQQRQAKEVTSRSRGRTIGAIKVILTNVPSFIYGLIFGTPLLLLLQQEDGLMNETKGWISFIICMVFPVFSSVWNPIVFVSLTPDSRRSVNFKLKCKSISGGV